MCLLLERLQYGFSNPNVRVITFRNADGTRAGSLRISRPTQKKPKKVQYNFKEVSARILNARTSGTARSALIMARSKTVQLRRQLKSGEYDDRELAMAIMHAEKLERVAKKKQKHLQEEERAERTGGNNPMMEQWEEQLEAETAGIPNELSEFGKEELKRLMEKTQKLMEELMESVDETGGLNEISEEVLGIFEELEPEDLKMRKKKHRADELREIMEADMQYLKALFEQLEKEKSEASGNASLQIGGAEMPVFAAEVPVETAVEGTVMDVSV